MSFYKNYKKYQGIAGLTSELKSIYTYERFKENNKSLLVVCNSLYEANRFYDALSNYTNDVLFFPMDDFLTSEALAISPELKITRLETLNTILSKKKVIVVTNLMGYLRYLPTPTVYKKFQLNFKVGDELDPKKLVEDLYKMGYIRETIVDKTGTMAIRGYVVDIFPISEKNPIRIEFWGDNIESIRTFDIDNQLTLNTLNSIEINPNNEFLTTKEVEFEKQKQKFLPNYEKVVNILSYFEEVDTIFDDYSQMEVSYKLLLEEIINYNISMDYQTDMTYMNDFYSIRTNPFYFFQFDNKKDDLKNYIQVSSHQMEAFSGGIEGINKRLNQYLRDKKIVIVCLDNRYQANKVIDELDNNNLLLTNFNEIYPNKINIVIQKIQQGFYYENYVVISENELFNKENHTSKYKSRFKIGTKVRDITKLNVGDYIVHSIHGIGRYCGIKTLCKNGLKKDYLTVEYRGGDKLYIPVEKIELISKYSSNDGLVPKINKLGSTEWEKTKLRVRKKIEDIAGDLLKLYAEREAQPGFAFAKDTEEQVQFEKEFAYQPTIDQLKVTEEIKKDMEASHPMDRLVCGDVGFGKTEIAFRAMFKCIMSGKQVAMLCPTTILSSQHYKNAIERFSSFAVRIALLNRFVTPKQVKQILKDLEDGKIDIIIGTHRILSEDVKFKDLGLLVIDEEQRFGVKHKEKIKQYRSSIDVLTLSATPIPRTLQMSMTGIRNLSLLETPPINRYPIQTYVLAENPQIIKDAIYKELSRKGQVFLLYNHIDDMDLKVSEISRLVPEARVISAHGQMGKSEIEEVMMKFTKQEYDVLICTTIIETGIDIPSVNTLIIIDADYFGLSQLYQIRGRVGRSNKIAYCYLMYDRRKILSEIATKRLSVIKDFTELGSGFAIAMRDLSIRGAGDILGSEQAGFIDSVGVELFLNMLQEEIERLKGKTVTKEEPKDTQPLLDVETAIDENYVSEEELKIEIHKKINQIDSYESLHKTKQEIEDRFGTISENLLIYMYEEWFEKLAEKLNIHKIIQTKNFVEIVLTKEMTEKVNGELLFIELSRISRMFRFSMKNNQLSIILDTVKLDKHFIYYLIELLEVLEKAVN